MSGIPDSVRCSHFRPGHQPHYLQARLLRRSPDHQRPGTVISVEALDATSLRIVTSGGTVRTHRNHQPERAMAAWLAHPEGAVLYPGWGLLGIRHLEEISGEMHTAEYLFSLSGGGYRTCDELTAEIESSRARSR